MGQNFWLDILKFWENDLVAFVYLDAFLFSYLPIERALTILWKTHRPSLRIKSPFRRALSCEDFVDSAEKVLVSFIDWSWSLLLSYFAFHSSYVRTHIYLQVVVHLTLDIRKPLVQIPVLSIVTAPLVVHDIRLLTSSGLWSCEGSL